MAPDLPILYSFRRCPYAMRARLALSSSQQGVQHREVDLKQRPAALVKVSPKATVPVLVLPDGHVLEESLDIMRWTLSNHDPEAWLPQTKAQQNLCDCLLQQNDGDFKFHLDRYKYAARYDDANPEEHRSTAAAFLQHLDLILQANPFLLGHHFSFADASIAPFVRQFSITDRTWFDKQSWDHLRRWLDHFIASDRFIDVMQKRPTWVEGA